MQNITETANSPLFDGIQTDNLNAILGWIGYHDGKPIPKRKNLR